MQGAWAILLDRQTGISDTVFGAAFAGRPSDLNGVESIVGPFVNNLPVRVKVDPEMIAGEFLQHLHARLLQLNHLSIHSTDGNPKGKRSALAASPL